eukprot:364743-Chlamydomonas_euryale.AAC.104
MLVWLLSNSNEPSPYRQKRWDTKHRVSGTPQLAKAPLIGLVNCMSRMWPKCAARFHGCRWKRLQTRGGGRHDRQPRGQHSMVRSSPAHQQSNLEQCSR